MNDKKWYNFETMFMKKAEALQQFLYDHDIKHEISGAFNCVHFEIFCNAEEVKLCNDFIDSIY